MTITILGLGPGDINDLSRKAWQCLEIAKTVYLRTTQHPCVRYLPAGTTYHSFDDLYDTIDNFSEVYATITQRILTEAKSKDVVYAVPGDPFVGESTTARIIESAKEANISVAVIHGISFIEPMLRQVNIDILDGLQIIDALQIAEMYHPPLNPDFPAVIGQVYSQAVASNVKLTLMNEYPDEFPVKLIHSAGTDGFHVEDIPLYELDRTQHINHLTSLYLPAMEPLSSFQSFQDVIAHLRAPEGCPWDREQTHESLRPFLIEEAYEVIEAIDNDDPNELMKELGDLLLQIVLHTQIAIENGEFYMHDVLRHVNQKMIRRHPHVWGDVDVDGNAEQVVTNWEAIKQQEKQANGEDNHSLLGSIPRQAPALWVAYKYTDKAAKVGFDWDSIDGVEDKIKEELHEILQADTPQEKIQEIGDLIFALVNWLRWLGDDDPESLLRQTNAKFYRRFRYIEEATHRNGSKPLADYTLQEMDSLWDEAKSHET